MRLNYLKQIIDINIILLFFFSQAAVKPKPQYLPNPNSHLEKRPTFENIDKRLSWSHDKYLAGPLPQDKYLPPGGQMPHPDKYLPQVGQMPHPDKYLPQVGQMSHQDKYLAGQLPPEYLGPPLPQEKYLGQAGQEKYYGAGRGPAGYPVRPMMMGGQPGHHGALGIPLHMGKTIIYLYSFKH